jgi:stage III sporulation protein SpoIIIAA
VNEFSSALSSLVLQARFQGDGKVQFLREEEITSEDLVCAVDNLGDFGGDNRAGIEGTLHRISCMRNRRGNIVRRPSIVP